MEWKGLVQLSMGLDFPNLVIGLLVSSFFYKNWKITIRVRLCKEVRNWKQKIQKRLIFSQTDVNMTSKLYFNYPFYPCGLWSEFFFIILYFWTILSHKWVRLAQLMSGSLDSFSYFYIINIWIIFSHESHSSLTS